MANISNNRDRSQKEFMLRYGVAREWFPQLELDVVGSIRLHAKKSLAVTDIDVFFSISDSFGSYSNLVVDCKSGNRTQPGQRVLWVRGLMDLIGANRGLCIVNKGIETEHRYTASELGITLLADSELKDFALTTAPGFERWESNLGRMENWECYFSIPQRFSSLESALLFSKSRYWMARSEGEALRNALIVLREIRNELDPEKPDHFAVFIDISALFLRSLSQIANRIYLAFLKPREKEDLADALLYIIYGGRDSYEMRNQMKRKLLEARSLSLNGPIDLTLPEWEKFVENARQTLDNPKDATIAPLLLREIAWGILAGKTSSDYASYLVQKFPHSVRFGIIWSEYLARAAKLPIEFSENLKSVLFEHVKRPIS